MLKEFREFILRGNVVDLAIAVAIGAAFTGVVTAITTNIITPLLAIPGDNAKFGDMKVTIAGAEFGYGAVIDALVIFVLTAAVLFFFVVKPINHLMARRKTGTEVESTTKECPECLSSIPINARRCAFCTAEQPAAA
jgi:large conductance mechanosensitive channel